MSKLHNIFTSEVKLSTAMIVPHLNKNKSRDMS